jgi:hypothetical protein
MTNEYKLSVLRSFGSEQFSITATLNCEKEKAQKEIAESFDQMNALIEESFYKVSERTDKERAFSIKKINERKEEVKKELIKEGKTEKQAQYEVDKIFNINK